MKETKSWQTNIPVNGDQKSFVMVIEGDTINGYLDGHQLTHRFYGIEDPKVAWNNFMHYLDTEMQLMADEGLFDEEVVFYKPKTPEAKQKIDSQLSVEHHFYTIDVLQHLAYINKVSISKYLELVEEGIRL